MNEPQIVLLIVLVLFVWIVVKPWIEVSLPRLRIYVVWVRDDSEDISKLVGITFTEWGAKRLIVKDQIERWNDITKDKWKAEWSYEPLLTNL